MQISIIGQVDSNNIVSVVPQEYLEALANGERVTTLCLLSRRSTKSGYLQALRAIESDRVEYLELHPGFSSDRIVWNDQNGTQRNQSSQIL